jgi:hypothetical protein
MRSKNPIDKISDQLKLFEIRYANKIAELINTATNGADRKERGGEEDDLAAAGGEEEYEEIEVPEWVLYGERGDAWQAYLAKHGIVIDITDPKNNQNSEYIWTLFQVFNREWDQQPQPKRMMRIKKKWTEEEKAALREQRKKEKEEANDPTKPDPFGFKD